MTRIEIRRSCIAALVMTVFAFIATVARSHDPADKATVAPAGSKIAKVFDQVLPKGDYQRVSSITVAYGPGGQSPKHRHDVAVFGYVLEGEIESQLAGEELKKFGVGQMWYEPPGTIHAVSRNASQAKPAKILVFFVQEEGKAATTLVK